jgi:hypothetical protein
MISNGWRSLAKISRKKEMTAFRKPFTTAKVHYFDHIRAAEARDWLAQK